jgi:hypothetical protein
MIALFSPVYPGFKAASCRPVQSGEVNASNPMLSACLNTGQAGDIDGFVPAGTLKALNKGNHGCRMSIKTGSLHFVELRQQTISYRLA